MRFLSVLFKGLFLWLGKTAALQQIFGITLGIIIRRRQYIVIHYLFIFCKTPVFKYK